jgi:hypothetical protein
LGALLVVALVTGAAGPGVAGDDDRVPSARWARQVCRAVATWEQRGVEASTIEIGAPADLPATLAESLRAMTKATKRLRRSLEKAGVPQVDGGRRVAGILAEVVDGTVGAMRARSATSRA